MLSIERVYFRVLQFTTIALTILLFWFAFVYYPKAIRDLENGKISYSPKFFKPIVATSYNFPIKTSAYTIEVGGKSDTYYVFINGRNLGEYEANRNSARLALKTALSLENTCNINVIYVSVAKLTVPDSLKTGDCRR